MFNGGSSESTTFFTKFKLRDQLVTIIDDENATHIQLDVVALLLCLKQIEGSPVGHEH